MGAVDKGWNRDQLFSSKEQTWQTPQWLFDYLDKRYRFDLDAAASRDNALCSNYLTKEDDALSMRSWPGSRIFVNPPYGREVGKFVAKAYQQSNMGRLVVMLIFARTDTAWWQDHIPYAAEVIFIRGRIRFLMNGKASGSATAPSAIVVFDPWINGPPKMTFLNQPSKKKE